MAPWRNSGRRPQKTLAGAESHELRFKGGENCLVLLTMWTQIPPEGSSHTSLHSFESPAPGGLGARAQGVARPVVFRAELTNQLWKAAGALSISGRTMDSSVLAVTMASLKATSLTLKSLFIKPVECRLIRINGAWAAPRHNQIFMLPGQSSSLHFQCPTIPGDCFTLKSTINFCSANY